MKKNWQFHATNFLKSLYRNCKEDGYINIRILPDGENIFIPRADLGSNAAVRAMNEIKKKYRDKDIYFAVATRKDGDGSKQGIIEITSLWADVDLKGRSWEEVWKMLMDLPTKPSVIIRTGGGFHVYFYLETPVSADKIPVIESLLKRLAAYLGADMNATDASRILRIPGTINHKRGYRVRIKSFYPSRRYKIEDFDFLPPVKEEKEPEKEFPSWSDILIAQGVRNGERNVAMAKLAGKYAGMGLSKVETLPILLEANSNFDPPLDREEVEKTLNSIARTESRNLDDTDKPAMAGRGEGMTLTQILAEPIEEPDYLIKPFLQAEDKGYLVSSYKVGKTLFAMQMTLSLATGIPFLGFPMPQARKVLFVRFELSRRKFKKSLHMMKAGLNPPGQLQVDPVYELVRGFNILGQTDFDWLIRMIDKHEPALLILDPFYKMTNLDLRDTSAAMPLIRRFESIRERYMQLCVLITAHQVKNARNDRDWDTTYGPMQFFADMDFEIRLRGKGIETLNPEFTLDYISNDEVIEPMTLRRDPDTLLYFPDHSVKEKKQNQETEEFEKVRGLLTAFIGNNGKNPNQSEFRQMIEDELKTGKKKGGKPGSSKALKIIREGEGKFWKGSPEGKGKAVLYEPIADNSVQTIES